eukprot:6305906-Pyramimonas_sp.AAC.1
MEILEYALTYDQLDCPHWPPLRSRHVGFSYWRRPIRRIRRRRGLKGASTAKGMAGGSPLWPQCSPRMLP